MFENHDEIIDYPAGDSMVAIEHVVVQKNAKSIYQRRILTNDDKMDKKLEDESIVEEQ